MVGRHYFARKKYFSKKHLISLYIHGMTFEFISYSSLFSGKEVDKGTRLLLENLIVPKQGNVLDLGCGYGVIGIVVAKLNPLLKVYMVDVNPLAIKATKYNAKINGVQERTVILQGDLYEPVRGMKFSAIYSNPPLSAGKSIVEKIIMDAPVHLEDNGVFQVVLAKGAEYYTRLINNLFPNVKTLKKQGYVIVTAYMK